MGECKRLTLHGDDIATVTLNHLCDHVVDQTMLVPDLVGLKVLLILGIIDLLENILELSIVRLEDSVLGAHVQRELLVKSELE